MKLAEIRVDPWIYTKGVSDEETRGVLQDMMNPELLGELDGGWEVYYDQQRPSPIYHWSKEKKRKVFNIVLLSKDTQETAVWLNVKGIWKVVNGKRMHGVIVDTLGSQQKFRGKDLPFKLYSWLVQKGQVIFSSYEQTPGSKQVWEKLVNSGVGVPAFIDRHGKLTYVGDKKKVLELAYSDQKKKNRDEEGIVLIPKEIAAKYSLTEMALPTEDLKNKIYYHGTGNQEAANEILKHGLKPGDIVFPNKHKKVRGPNLTPVNGKVYLTQSLAYAQMYAIGGDIAGWAGGKEKGYGYVFEIDGSALRDVDPDEDSVGEMIHNAMVHNRLKAELSDIVDLALRLLTPSQLKRLRDGEYVMYAHTGKKIMPRLTDEQKNRLIVLGAHVAHQGEIGIKAAYRINKKFVPDLKRDASNFFDLAEKVA